MSLALANRDGGKTSELGLYSHLSSMVSGDVLSGFRVRENSTLGMNVRIGGEYNSSTGENKDNALIRDGLKTYTVFTDDGAAIVASVNTPHATLSRQDRVVLYVDKTQARLTTVADNTNGVVKAKVVPGTPDALPVPPNASAIQSSIGAGNPYIVLGLIIVAPSPSSTITQSYIFDERVLATIGIGQSASGYTPIKGSVSGVTPNGNRSYSAVLTQDNSVSISKGTRVMATRTTPAPILSANLNGTNQYFSKTSPVGMTFTDDFVVSAWIKLSSYQANSVIASRFNNTSGWELVVGALGSADGRVQITGYNGSGANYSLAVSYQSIPLNRWVHVAAQLDMSSFTATTTTTYIMIDGVDVPCAVQRNGTNPVSLVQAGNLEIGSRNGGSGFFPGRIAQVGIFSAKVTQALIRSYMNQGLIGTETSLVSGYSLSGSINDLNTSNANNLTANASANASFSDAPFGGKSDGTNSSVNDWGIVQSISPISCVIQMAEGCTLTTNGGITFAFSSTKMPFGFPGKIDKFKIVARYRSQTMTSINNATQGLLGAMITAPSGAWRPGHRGHILVTSGSLANMSAIVGLSTSSSSFSPDLEETQARTPQVSSASSETDGSLHTIGDYETNVATPLYLVAKTFGAYNVYHGSEPYNTIFLENAWL